MKSFDIDIDCASIDLHSIFPTAVKASMVRDGELVPHPCGAYFQDLPIDPLTRLSAVPYAEAEELGAIKLDFLHLNIYDKFTSREEITELIKIDPDWNLLQIPSVVSELFQLSKHLDLLREVKPTSLIELADCLALIRPQKRHLLKYYLRDRDKCRPLLYQREEGGYAFKKAHAVSYAMVVILQLHLIKAGIV